MIISKYMNDLQACLFKYTYVAAFHIFAQRVKMSLKGEVGGHALNSHGNYIFDHEKSWKKHGIVFLNFCGNLAITSRFFIFLRTGIAVEHRSNLTNTSGKVFHQSGRSLKGMRILLNYLREKGIQ